MTWANVSEWVKILTPKLMLSVCLLSAILIFSPAGVIVTD